MASIRYLPAAAALLAAGCAPDVSGVVRDAATEHPVAGAVVEVYDSGWGIRGGQLVWDAEKISRATSDGDGRFTLDIDGGHRLRVTVPGSAAVDTSLCARSPMTVLIGGPFAAVRADRGLVFQHEGPDATDGTQPASYVAILDDVTLRASGDAFADGHGLRMEAEAGIRFVPGTGTIPRPPPMPYERSAQLDLRSDCGWLFVSNGTSPIVAIEVGPLASRQDPGQARQWMMLYGALPDL